MPVIVGAHTWRAQKTPTKTIYLIVRLLVLHGKHYQSAAAKKFLNSLREELLDAFKARGIKLEKTEMPRLSVPDSLQKELARLLEQHLLK